MIPGMMRHYNLYEYQITKTFPILEFLTHDQTRQVTDSDGKGKEEIRTYTYSILAPSFEGETLCEAFLKLEHENTDAVWELTSKRKVHHTITSVSA